MTCKRSKCQHIGFMVSSPQVSKKSYDSILLSIWRKMSREKSLHASTSLFLEILKSWPPTKKCPNEGTSFLDKVQITSRIHFTFSLKSWPYKLQSVLMKVRLSWTKLKSLKASTSLFPNNLKSWPKKCPMKVRPSWTKSTLQIRNKTTAAINWRHFMFECRTINAANPKARAIIKFTIVIDRHQGYRSLYRLQSIFLATSR